VDVREIIETGLTASLYQPIVQLVDGGVVAHEALTRGPAGSPLECPRRLFAAAAEQGCEPALDAACRSAALRRATEAGWAAGADGPLFLNARPGALADPAFLPGLERAVAAVGRAPRDVVLELSEAERLDGGGDLHRHLAACRAAGFWIALDDAGAGQCGLQAIVEVMPDVVKVDRALVSGMDAHRGRRAAVAALAGLARELGIVLVAEGIETEGELRVARELGVPLGQGFLLGRPAERCLPGGSIAAAAARVAVAREVASALPAAPLRLRRRYRRPGFHRGG
jgi:EAL domain-containing protein (putative c-di-GMP-specific phosphodiesterase class I)